MADKERERPSLELPSFRFGRNRKQREPATAPVDSRPVPEPAAQSEPPPEPERAPAEPALATTQRAEAAPPDPAPTGAHDEPDTPVARRGFSLPATSGPAASVVTGILVGVIGVGLVWGSTRLCELVRGTSACGTPGFLLLLAVVAVAALLGKYLLQALGVPEPLSTSVLGVGLTTAVTLLFLGGQLFEWWMVIAVPLVAAACYAVSHIVTTAVVGPIEDNLHR